MQGLTAIQSQFVQLLVLVRLKCMHYCVHRLAHLKYDLVGCLLLLRLVEDVDAPARLVGGVRHIVPPAALVLIRKLLNSGDILLAEFNFFEVLCDSGGGNRFGNDRVTADLTPGQDNLSRCSTLLLSDSLDLRTCDEKRDVEEVVAES